MGAQIERALLARAEELADTGDLAERVTEIIGWARAARVDQEALGGLVTAVRLLDGDVIALFRAVRGRYQAGKFSHDTELLEIVEEVEGDISDRVKAAARLRRQAGEALQRARSDAAAASRQLSQARAMHVTDPCRGCHPARDRAIDAAQDQLADAQKRANCAGAALETLAPLKLPEALQAVRRVPEDLRGVYEAVYDLVTQDPEAMPKDGDFITGRTSPADMAARMLAARVPASKGPASRPAGHRHGTSTRPTVPGSDDAAVAAGPASSAQQLYAPSEGDRVRARRYEQPTLSRSDPDRKLAGEWTGIAAGPDAMRIIDDQGEYSGEYLDFGYVFLGGSPEDGARGYLVTDVEPLPPAETDTPRRHDQEIAAKAAKAAQAAPAQAAGTDATCACGQAPATDPAFDAAEADRQMYAALGRNDGWRSEMASPHNGARSHRYRYTNPGHHTGTIEVAAEGFRWETASNRDGTPLASGTTTAIAEAFRAVTSGGPAPPGAGTWARAAASARLASFNAQLAEGWKRRARQAGYLRAAYGIDPDEVSYLALPGRPGEVAARLSQAREHLLDRRFAAMDHELAAVIEDLVGSPGARGARSRRSVTELRERLRTRLSKPEVIGLDDGQTRPVTRRWPDGSWTCPWCESPAMAGEALAEWSRGCPNPACRVNMTAAQLADARRRDDAKAERGREAESIGKFIAGQAAQSRQREAELWIAAEAEAQRRGACIQCLRKSAWRSGRPKFVRHRSQDYHSPAAKAPEAQ